MALKHWIGQAIAGAERFLRRAAGDARGNVAMIFGLTMPVLILMTVGGVDIHRATTVRMNLQDSLDAATLAAARSPHTDAAKIQEVGLAALKANLKNYPDIILLEDQTTFVLNAEEVVIADARVNVKTLVANIFLPPYGQFMDEYLPVGSHSEVDRSSRNIEVALVLDVTGSMGGSRITALKEAAINLINIVVQPANKQTPYYSKAAIIPYSIGVNAGGYANAVRGNLTGPTNITGASWAAADSKNITRIRRRTSPAEVVASGHGLATGDYVWISGVSNMSSLNGRAYRITKVSNDEFTLNGVNTSGFDTNGSGGTVRKCIRPDCAVIVQSNNHTMSTGDYVSITGVRGMTQLNVRSAIERIDNNSFVALGVRGPANAYTSAGSAQCGYDGCKDRVFTRADGIIDQVTASTCVTDRAGAEAYTDAAPRNGSWLGRLYPASDACSSREITPLSDRSGDLVTEIGKMQANGSTAGQIGFAWGWYMLSDKFNSVWPAGSQAAANDPAKTVKAIILMTDGEFNTTYCQGVLADDAGYDGDSNQINCNATNGDPFTQTARLCDEIKKVRKPGDALTDPPAIVIYTVGFSVSTSRGRAGIDTAREVLEHCATTPDRAKFATNSDQLKDAFEEFARDITQLRISK